MVKWWCRSAPAGAPCSHVALPPCAALPQAHSPTPHLWLRDDDVKAANIDGHVGGGLLASVTHRGAVVDGGRAHRHVATPAATASSGEAALHRLQGSRTVLLARAGCCRALRRCDQHTRWLPHDGAAAAAVARRQGVAASGDVRIEVAQGEAGGPPLSAQCLLGCRSCRRVAPVHGQQQLLQRACPPPAAPLRRGRHPAEPLQAPPQEARAGVCLGAHAAVALPRPHLVTWKWCCGGRAEAPRVL
jgi:hypothetical protein